MSSTSDDENTELQRERYQSILQSLSKAPKFTEEWFRLKEEELSLRGLMPAETTAPQRAADGSSLHDAPSTLTGSIESIPDDTDPPLPHPSLELTTNADAKEQIDSEDAAAKKEAASDYSVKSACAKADKGSPSDCNSTSGGEGSTNEGREDKMAQSNMVQPSNVVESNAVYGYSADTDKARGDIEKNGPRMYLDVTDGLTQIMDVDAPIPSSQRSPVSQVNRKQTKLELAPIQLPDDPNIPLPAAAMHLKDDIAYEMMKASSITPVQMANEEDHPIPPQFMHADAAIHKAVAFENPLRSVDTSARLDDVSLVPPSASIRAADKVVPPRNMDDEIAVDPEQPQMQAEDENAEAFIPQEDQSQPVNFFLTQQDLTTEHGIVIPEAFLVTDEMIGDDIPSAEIVPTEKYSVTIAGRKIRIGFLVLAVFILMSAVAGVSIYATTAGNKGNTLTEDATVARNTSKVDDIINVMNARAENITDELERHVLARNKFFNELPQADVRTLALNWIIDDDTMKLSASDSNLHQRYILALLGVHYKLDWLSRWLSEENECFWFGVSCHEHKVTEIILTKIGLKGTLPPEIGGLQFLESLDLSSNSFLTGSLPSEIGSLHNLAYLDLSENYGLAGSLPTEIGSLHNLTFIDLHFNSLTGRMPSEIGSLSKLTYLDLDINSLTGSLPSEIGNLRNLTYLDLGINSLTDSLPSEIGNLHNLTYLDLKYNKLSGSLPSEIGNLRKLTELDLSENSLTGSLSSEIGDLRKLTELDLSENSLNGTLPTDLGDMILANLTDLDISFNLFTGLFPESIVNATRNMIENLEVWEYAFCFCCNRFTSNVPEDSGGCDW